jgi:hypothetical protein
VEHVAVVAQRQQPVGKHPLSFLPQEVLKADLLVGGGDPAVI